MISHKKLEKLIKVINNMKFNKMEKLESALESAAEVLECEVKDILKELVGKLIDEEDYFEFLDFIS